MNRLISMDYSGFTGLLTEFLILLLMSALIIWLVVIVSSFIQQKKINPKRAFNHITRLSFLNALLWYMIIFSLYFGIFVAVNGKHSFMWDKFPLNESNTYYLILPQLSTYLVVIGVYTFSTISFKKILKYK